MPGEPGRDESRSSPGRSLSVVGVELNHVTRIADVTGTRILRR